MKVALGYARVSTDEQARDNNSLNVQKSKIATYCDQNGLHLLNIFEASESARTMVRPGLQKLLNYCREHRKEVSHVIVSDLSRLARNVQDQAEIIVALKQLGITMVSIDEPLTDDSAMGQLTRNMLGSINQFFSDALSERTRTRMQAAVKTGRFLWPAPIGYLNLNKKLHPDPERAPLVRQAFELVASGRFVTTDAVLKLVTSLGLRTKKGAAVTKQSFARMLSNPVYAGWVVSGDIRVEGTHEPLVSKELFDVVQQRLRKKGEVHKKLNEDFPLRGIVRCAKCGKLLTAAWAKGRTNKYARYWCYTPGCHAVGVSRDDLEWQFKSLLGRMEPTAQLLAKLPERVAAVWKERKGRIAVDERRLRNLLAEQKTLNQKAVAARVKGDISAEDFDLFKANIAEEVSRIEAALNVLDSEQVTVEELIKQTEVEAIDLVAAWEKGNVNQRQELAKAFFPDGLVYSHELKFFEPANTVITEMVMRFLENLSNVGVPDGI